MLSTNMWSASTTPGCAARGHVHCLMAASRRGPHAHGTTGHPLQPGRGRRQLVAAALWPGRRRLSDRRHGGGRGPHRGRHRVLLRALQPQRAAAVHAVEHLLDRGHAPARRLMARRLLTPRAILLLLGACRQESSLPKLFPVPDASLVSETGKPVRLAEMKGYVTVYDFIFTNCAGTCPMMTATLRRLTSKVDKDAKV